MLIASMSVFYITTSLKLTVCIMAGQQDNTQTFISMTTKALISFGALGL